ncbi:hypothetical protein RSJ42_11875 [Methanosarcina hadiensis]|uniref:hypothetical protein n=1 Tax=Methanosarcina hadiensis TaxID=3078083 RepID=UPI003977BDC5
MKPDMFAGIGRLQVRNIRERDPLKQGLKLSITLNPNFMKVEGSEVSKPGAQTWRNCQKV